MVLFIIILGISVDVIVKLLEYGKMLNDQLKVIPIPILNKYDIKEGKIEVAPDGSLLSKGVCSLSRLQGLHLKCNRKRGMQNQ